MKLKRFIDAKGEEKSRFKSGGEKGPNAGASKIRLSTLLDREYRVK